MSILEIIYFSVFIPIHHSFGFSDIFLEGVSRPQRPPACMSGFKANKTGNVEKNRSHYDDTVVHVSCQCATIYSSPVLRDLL